MTRGAIYWHFDDKGALFNAMMERVTLPLEKAKYGPVDPDKDPLLQLRDQALEGLRVTVADPQARRVFEIATLKIEFVAEMEGVRQRRQENLEAGKLRSEACLRLGMAQGVVRPEIDPRASAIGLWVLMEGLIRNWLFDPAAFDLLAVGTTVVETYLNGLRVCTP